MFVVIPDFSSSQNAVRAIYHAVKSYKDCLTSANKFEINLFSEPDEYLPKNIKQYIKEHFGSDAMTVDWRRIQNSEFRINKWGIQTCH